MPSDGCETGCDSTPASCAMARSQQTPAVIVCFARFSTATLSSESRVASRLLRYRNFRKAFGRFRQFARGKAPNDDFFLRDITRDLHAPTIKPESYLSRDWSA